MNVEAANLVQTEEIGDSRHVFDLPVHHHVQSLHSLSNAYHYEQQ